MNYFRKHYNAPGSPPGLLEPRAEAAPCRVQLLRYDAERYLLEDDVSPRQCAEWLARGERLWLNLDGRPDPALLAQLDESLGLHPLALEDVLHGDQRAKVEDYEDHLFLVLRRPSWVGRKLAIGQVSLFLGRGFVISIDETGGDLFAPVRRRLETSPGGRIRSNGVDYLFYALVDMVVDQGFPILEGYAEELEELELAVMANPKQRELMDRIHESRRELMFLRRALWSQREALAQLLRTEQALIGEGTLVYLRDAADHASHILDLAESYRDMSAAVLDLLISALNRQMNEVMRVLTIIATLFIPLSFVTGIYGMNFDPAASPWNMPELGWRYGYPGVLALLAAAGGGMLWWFKRKGWW
ncbi:magnesium/cobalt transporter CorA [Alkalilimnicola sp. S0819]|uniref:magnesium/cobalt transporter CorA n=1 Tax=Alkalilimnicola sp. S0819 TaxID=2613922 RepID=UPI0012624159|nr:magnesium/cobalt transporter CorA [Alkalilimnicola sp. S0819]KAB7624015.1 magnesium/cobalt transporter CorA [Alkalilimnicola sp. S0819]MPQ16623.1 magnesium/cobalt transporter CorA [Alkalilimnicola sp. S0819]